MAAKANVQRSAAEVVLAQQRFDRSKPLSERNILGQQAVDDAAAALAVAQAAEAAAKAELNTAEINLAYATITAPIAGKVGRINETTGNVVQAGGSHLLTIVADDEIDVVFDLPDRVWLQHAAAIQSAIAGDSEMKVEVSSGNLTGEAQLLMVENQVEANSATVRIYARQPNPDGTLLPGVFAEVRLFSRRTERTVSYSRTGYRLAIERPLCLFGG